MKRRSDDPTAIAQALDEDERQCLRDVCTAFREVTDSPAWKSLVHRRLAVAREDGPWPTMLGKAVRDELEVTP